ncbi:tetratricopeptide repeat protein 19, mitochondrial [Pelodytes ibericus]
MKVTSSPMCWKGCGHTGTYFHMWRDCPLIKHYWTQVQKIISRVRQKPVPTDPGSYLQSKPHDTFTKQENLLMARIALAARRALAQVWNHPSIPTMSKVRAIIEEVMDNLTALLHDTYKTFYKTWGPWREENPPKDVTDWDRYITSVGSSSAISKSRRFLDSGVTVGKSSAIKHWETDLGKSFTLREWFGAWQEVRHVVSWSHYEKESRDKESSLRNRMFQYVARGVYRGVLSSIGKSSWTEQSTLTVSCKVACSKQTAACVRRSWSTSINQWDGCGRYKGRRNGNGSFIAGAAAFSLFYKLGLYKEKKEEDIPETEKKVISLIKEAKVSIINGDLERAEEILHEAVPLAQESERNRAIIYTYDLMANLAFIRGQLDQAERLFKTTMIYMLNEGVKQDDNSFIELSLKLACIYAEQNKNDLAVAGFQFCILTLNEKLKLNKDVKDTNLEKGERTNTRLLLGLCLDSYARYLKSKSKFPQAQKMYEKALEICKEEQGELHPQSVTLMNDLATVLESQGRHDEAYEWVAKALELAKKSEHPDQHVVLSNLAMILMCNEKLNDVEKNLKEALRQAREKEDSASIAYIKEGLSELEKKKKKKQ